MYVPYTIIHNASAIGNHNISESLKGFVINYIFRDCVSINIILLYVEHITTIHGHFMSNTIYDTVE